MAASSTSFFPSPPLAVHRLHRTNNFFFPSNPRNSRSNGRANGLTVQHSRSLRFQVLCALRPTAVTKDTWEEKILKSEIPVLVEFHASWCGPCRMVHRVIDEIAEEYDGKLKCCILDTDTDLQIAEDYEIKAVPVVLIFKNGEKQESIVGTMPKDFYVAAIERVLKL